MDIIQILLIITAAVGLFLMILTVLRLKDSRQGSDYFETGNSIKAINSSLDEAERAANDLSKFAESVMNDIDSKHKELLFIYNLIDEKKTETASLYSAKNTPPRTNNAKQTSLPQDSLQTVKNNIPAQPKKSDIPAQSKKSDIHPKHKEIITEYNNGRSVAEIAKSLNMGQGEVKLIIELAKAR